MSVEPVEHGEFFVHRVAVGPREHGGAGWQVLFGGMLLQQEANAGAFDQAAGQHTVARPPACDKGVLPQHAAGLRQHLLAEAYYHPTDPLGGH